MVHFLHIGKTGGTAVRDSLRGVSPPDFHLVLHRHNVRLADVPQGDSAIFFVRDPLARYVSGWWSRHRQGRPRYNVPWSEGEREAFSRFTTPNDMAEALSGSRWRRGADEGMRAIIHLRPQFEWVKDERRAAGRSPEILFVGAQEQLGADFERLCGVLGISGVLLLTGETEAHRTPEGLDRRLSERARENLRAWYAEDYALLAGLRSRFPHLPEYGAE